VYSLRFDTHSAQETHQLGCRIGTCLKPGDVLLLTGDLGAGKTQFSQGVGVALGVEESILSPTFNILLVHHGMRDGQPITLDHWDLYRLDDADELFDVDYFAHVASEAISLVEWGDKFTDTLIDAALELVFTRTSEQERYIEAKPHSPRGAELIEQLSGLDG